MLRGTHSAEGAGFTEALRLLFWLRLVAVVSQAIVVAAVHFGLGIELPLGPLTAAITALAGWNALVFVRLRDGRAVSQGEVALNLTVDIAAFTAVLYLAGGSTNPFVSLYLVPIALAATSLSARYAWAVGGLCGAGYSLLLVRHLPLPSVEGRFGGDFDLHIIGMWINFLVAAALIVFFVGQIARLLRQRDREIAGMRETALRDQQIVALGTLAAGTAHELNTPLSTLMLLVEELEETLADDEQRCQLHTMREQIGVMGRRLNEIAQRVGAQRSEGARCVGMHDFLDTLLSEWRDTHPGLTVNARYELAEPELAIIVEATVEQAIRNVLDNAAHATRANSGSEIDVVARSTSATLMLGVVDRGAGIDPGVKGDIGTRIVTTKERGLGIGLLLSRAALQRFGGGLQLREAAAGGVEAMIELPLQGLVADER